MTKDCRISCLDARSDALPVANRDQVALVHQDDVRKGNLLHTLQLCLDEYWHTSLCLWYVRDIVMIYYGKTISYDQQMASCACREAWYIIVCPLQDCSHQDDPV